MNYEQYFGLHEAPFAIAPDPKYLYLTQQHQEALAHLLWGIEQGGGFVLLTGEIGTGKTTLCRYVLEQLADNIDVAVILNPKLTVTEFLQNICDEFGLPETVIRTNNKRVLVKTLYKYLLDGHGKGRNAVLIVDEAQNIDYDVMEYLRLLTNLETNEKKLLQIILVGQPELRDMINAPRLQQMAQRISARFHLQSLSKQDTRAYIAHRLSVAGADRNLFDDKSLLFLWHHTHGTPRLINAICDRALLGAYLEGAGGVDLHICQRAAAEVTGRERAVKTPVISGVWRRILLIFLVVLSAFLLTFLGIIVADRLWQHSGIATAPVHGATLAAVCGGPMTVPEQRRTGFSG